GRSGTSTPPARPQHRDRPGVEPRSLRPSPETILSRRVSPRPGDLVEPPTVSPRAGPHAPGGDPPRHGPWTRPGTILPRGPHGRPPGGVGQMRKENIPAGRPLPGSG